MDGFGERLTAAREAKSLTQDQLAALLGVQRQAVNRWEKGRRRPRGVWLTKLATALDTTVEALDGETPLRELHEEAFRAGQREAARQLRELADALESGPIESTEADRAALARKRARKGRRAG